MQKDKDYYDEFFRKAFVIAKIRADPEDENNLHVLKRHVAGAYKESFPEGEVRDNLYKGWREHFKQYHGVDL